MIACASFGASNVARIRRGLKTLFTRRRFRALGASLVGALALLFALDRLFPPPIPSPEARVASSRAQIVLARDGTPLRAFPDLEHIGRLPVRIEDVSPRYLDAVIAYEDRWFHYHPGVNPVSLVRAAW
ncbi:MAG: transglycosylase domain-containing protein, partial [Candidatus Accumulibacter sp.]|nr:transglycosylase domain-containing protein [Accumulibacter sp.]